MTRTEYLYKLASKRVLLLDGAFGTQLQKQHLDDEAYATDCIDGKDRVVYGLGEVLNLTRPDIIYGIHESYLDCGCDIITTNTFNCNALVLAEYDLEAYVGTIAQAACEIARSAAREAEHENGRYVFIAGSMGPTGKMLSFSTDAEDVTKRVPSYDDFVKAYEEEAVALLIGGCDILLLETAFDTLVCKAALEGIHHAFLTTDIERPIMVSLTLSDESGRSLSGQGLAAFHISLQEEKLFSLGLNCSLGAAELAPFIQQLDQFNVFYTSLHPNAGLPDENGNYAESPQHMVEQLLPLLKEGKVNVIGGCCGTGPAHIQALHAVLGQAVPRKRRQRPARLTLCGLDSFTLPDRIAVVGERNNVAGSKKFRDIVLERRWEDGLSIARAQVDKGADILDICMDGPMIDGVASMRIFLRYLVSDPKVSRVPFMIDSSDFEIVLTAFKELQGKCIVNSISLKEGETTFLEKAEKIHRAQAAMVVMLFDEKGQADTYERKCEVARRSYDLLVAAGIPSADIIFDPNVLAVATGIEEHDRCAKDFVDALRFIKENCPGTSCIGGVSNLSFSFRGNNAIRKAMHTVFLDRAFKDGLDLAIIDPGLDLDVEKVPTQIRSIITEALFDPSPEHREKLITLALELGNNKQRRSVRTAEPEWRNKDVASRLKHALLEGLDTFLETDVKELLAQVEKEGKSPVSIIEGPLMEGMGAVGDLFSQGKLFLPQIVKSARTMKKVVAYLQPSIESSLEQTGVSASTGTIVFATVKGDVHDIGKNICTLVLGCNGFRIIDLGVMVEAEKIVETAISQKADIICLSGLITPSLKEMEHTLDICREHGLEVPVIVGGATTSEAHTALRLRRHYPYVLQESDASSLARLASQLMSDRKGTFTTYDERYRLLVEMASKKDESNSSASVGYASCFDRRFIKKQPSAIPASLGVVTLEDITYARLEPYIRWNTLVHDLRVKPGTPQAAQLKEDIKALRDDAAIADLLDHCTKACMGMFRASGDGICIKVGSEQFCFPRQENAEGQTLCLADYCCEKDYIGLFALTAGLGVAETKSKLDEEDPYKGLLLQFLTIRMAEACSMLLEDEFAKVWGRPLIKPAPGYPICADHSAKEGIFRLLQAEERIGIRLTENYMMEPLQSICAFVFQGPDAAYFKMGKISHEQAEVLCTRKHCSLDDLQACGLQVMQ
ncbi:MAG: methionine synthase [Spirochaetia bacterium]|jgi:5-methyltetrahydrofolate--homocysteine methyltransferase|nr:methionine synthase [Spirochaetia bacterium]